MTPLEKVLQRQNTKSCLNCKDRVEIGGISYCQIDGKMIHPLLLNKQYYTRCPDRRAEGGDTVECTKVNCPMQSGTPTDNCGENCPWRTTEKTGDLISRAAAIEAVYYHSTAVGMIKKVPAVDAIPVGWIIDRANDPERAPLYRRYAQMLYEEWQKEQEAR